MILAKNIEALIKNHSNSLTTIDGSQLPLSHDDIEALIEDEQIMYNNEKLVEYDDNNNIVATDKVQEFIDERKPYWIDHELTKDDLEAIQQGGCASGAYMPAVTYYQATETMSNCGDAVLEYIEEQYGEIPQAPSGSSWSGIAVHYLSMAVELWASSTLNELEGM